MNGTATPPPAEARRSRRVLVVDDNPIFLDILKSHLLEKRDPTWIVHTADNYSMALNCLKSNPVDLAILDINMPLVDGLQLLTMIKHDHPSLPVVLLSSLVKPEARQFALDHGAALVLDKTEMGSHFDDIYPALEATAAKPVEGFEGVVRQVGLTEVLQLECLGRKSSVLEVKGTNAGGSIYISEGSIIHAEAGDLVGVPALARLLGLKGGQFKLQPFTQPSQQSLEGQWEGLLMEAAQASDEQAGQQAELSKASALDRRVEEVVLISDTKEILFQLSAPEAAKRVALLDWMGRCSVGLSRNIPALGQPDRLEILDKGSRMICAFPPETKIFVRLSMTPCEYADAVNASSRQSWMEKAAQNPVVLAYGLRHSHSSDVQTRHEAFPDASVSQVLQRLSEVVATLHNLKLSSLRLRWVFEHIQIQSAQSTDDTIAFVVTNNDPGVAPAVQELFSVATTVPAGPEISGKAA
jgi:CheY-like chemotaxis protein